MYPPPKPFNLSPRIDGVRSNGSWRGVDDGGHVGRDFFARPAVGLLKELEFEVVDPECAELWSREIEQLVPLGRTFACQEVDLVVAVEVVLVHAALERHAFEELVGDVGVASGIGERRQTVELREDAIFDRAWLHLARLPDDRQHPKPPSNEVPLVASKGVIPHVNTSAPLSVVKMTMVLFSSPMSLM